jgi:hypothetical protein
LTRLPNANMLYACVIIYMRCEYDYVLCVRAIMYLIDDDWIMHRRETLVWPIISQPPNPTTNYQLQCLKYDCMNV